MVTFVVVIPMVNGLCGSEGGRERKKKLKDTKSGSREKDEVGAKENVQEDQVDTEIFVCQRILSRATYFST